MLGAWVSQYVAFHTSGPATKGAASLALRFLTLRKTDSQEEKKIKKAQSKLSVHLSNYMWPTTDGHQFITSKL